MPNYYAVTGNQRQPLRLELTPIGSGGEADIHRVANMPGMVAKIYHGGSGGNHASRAKLQAMIARPPQHLVTRHGGQDLPLFAWPTQLVEDDAGRCAGFLMQEIQIGKAVRLSKYTSRVLMRSALSLDDCSLPRRLQVCRNLAAAIAEMHRQQHYFVDVKPQNIVMFKDTGIVCLLDNDSFSIAPAGAGARFPASAFTPEYLAPELLRNSMSPGSVLSDTQDRFALAVLMFQILNFGLHPFQGVPQIATDEWNIDLCVKQGYYPHGRQPHAAIRPSPASMHDCWEADTRALFDRAFVAAPSQRPSAEEWRAHLDKLQVTAGTFTRCDEQPQDVLHIHFAGQPCPECRMAALANTIAAAAQPVAGVVPASRPPAPLPVASPPTPAPRHKKWLNGVVAAIVAVVVLGFVGQSRNDRQFVADAAPPSLPAPASAVPPVAAPLPPAQPVAPAPTPGHNTDGLASASGDSSSTPIEAARALADPADVAGANARIAVIEAAIRDSNEENLAGRVAVLEHGLAGDDAATLASARARMRGTEFHQHFVGWQRFAREARAINDEVLQNYRADPAGAVTRQSRAVALNPWDREAAGNLAFYMALAGNTQGALNVAAYSLSLPRRPDDAGRGADWQMLGSMYARQGMERESRGAFFVGLAITPNLSGFCRSLIAQQADFGESLKAPLDSVFKRIAERGGSETEGCAYPPAWRG